MKEAYLHHIWLMKRLPMHKLTLTDGRKIDVIRTGCHNHDSGPDFFNGAVRIGGIEWNGNIEMHLKSSDWYAHKHHLDAAYDNVILHVVYQHDKPVFIGVDEIPVLELRPLIDQRHLSSFESLVGNSRWIPCAAELPAIDPVFTSMQIESAVLHRLERKAELLDRRFSLLGNDLRQLIYETVAQSFGTRVNALPFVELTQRMPVKTIWREKKEVAPALLLGAAGFLENPEETDGYRSDLRKHWQFYALKHSIRPMDKLSWKFKGLRPPGYPHVRITQFAEIASSLHADFSVFEKSVDELSGFFFKNTKASFYPLTKSFNDLLLINSIVPLLWWWGGYKNEAAARRKALDLLEKTAPENNEIINSWKKIGISCKSAFDSQGLLELKNEFCNNKKCLSCKIGNKILGK